MIHLLLAVYLAHRIIEGSPFFVFAFFQLISVNKAVLSNIAVSSIGNSLPDRSWLYVQHLNNLLALM